MTEGNVRSLRPEQELAEFFSSIWGRNQGFVYLPTKHPDPEMQGKPGEWETNWFRWPQEREAIIEHVTANTSKREVYYGPALYKNANAPVKENILGTQVLWTEFDGNAPRDNVLGDKIPQPTLRVRSSNEGHEHYYWHLDHLETDVETIEKINMSIAYTLRADTSAWDATQILRPTSTKNHKRDKVVRTITTSATEFSLDFFSRLEVPKQLVKAEQQLGEIPEPIFVLGEYNWPKEDLDFFRKRSMETGTRSSALMRLAYLCAEKKLSDEAAYSILRNADDRWKKFSGRRDQTRRLLDLVNKARQKYPLDAGDITDNVLEYFMWEDFGEIVYHVDWLIPGILQRQGVLVLSGKPGIGKSQIAMNILKALATGRNIFSWKIDTPRKVMFISMEMTGGEVQYFWREMNSVLSDAEKKLMQENYAIIPRGEGLFFDDKVHKKIIQNTIEKFKPEIICFDSFSKTTMGKLEEEKVKAITHFADQLRNLYDTTILFIHHNRKGQIGNKSPNDLDDMYGSYWLGAAATTAVGLFQKEGDEKIQVTFWKVRLAEAPEPMYIIRQKKGLQFVEVSPLGLIEGGETNATGPGVQDKKPEPSSKPFNSDFG